MIKQPRLGPKPFSSVSADISFDQTFSVPSAPGSLDEGDANNEQPQQKESPPPAVVSLQEDASGEDDDRVLLREKATADSIEGIYSFFFKLYLISHYNGSISFEDTTNGDLSDVTESNSLEEDLQKAISTAERRKVNVRFISFRLNIVYE